MEPRKQFTMKHLSCSSSNGVDLHCKHNNIIKDQFYFIDGASGRNDGFTVFSN
jgi:hypothetical protein